MPVETITNLIIEVTEHIQDYYASKSADAKQAYLTAYTALLTEAIDAGIDLNSYHPEGFTLLMEVIGVDKNAAFITTLLEIGVDLNKANDHKVTPLMVAILSENEKIISELIKRNVDLTIENEDGHSALTIAHIHSPKIAPILLENIRKYHTPQEQHTIVRNLLENLKKYRDQAKQECSQKKNDLNLGEKYSNAGHAYEKYKTILYTLEQQKQKSLSNFTANNKNLMTSFDTAANYFNQNKTATKFSRKTHGQQYSYIQANEQDKNGKEAKEIYALINGNYLGEGAFGKVKLAMNQKGELFAVKIEDATATKKSGKNSSEMRALEASGSLRARAHRIFSVFKPFTLFKKRISTAKNYTILHRIEGEDLDKIIESEAYLKNSTPVQRVMLATHAALSIADIHAKNIIHNDIKPANFVGKLDFETGVPNVSVVDFGLSNILPPQSGKTTIHEASQKGTRGYMDDNLKNYSSAYIEYSFDTDIYALAITLEDIFKSYAPDDEKYKFTKPQDKESKEAIKELIEKMADSDKSNRPSAQAVADKLVMILKNMPKPENQAERDTVTQFITNYERIDTAQKNLLRVASEGNIVVINRLAAMPGININIQDNDGLTPLMLAFKSKHFDAVQALLDAGANPDLGRWSPELSDQWEAWRTPLIQAIKEYYLEEDGEDLKTILELINNGADVNQRDKDGNTALMWTVKLDNNKNTAKIKQALMDHGADPMIKNKNGEIAADMFGANKYNKAIVNNLIYELGVEIENNSGSFKLGQRFGSSDDSRSSISKYSADYSVSTPSSSAKTIKLTRNKKK